MINLFYSFCMRLSFPPRGDVFLLSRNLFDLVILIILGKFT